MTTQNICSLEFWIGQEVSAMIPMFTTEGPVSVKICGVEPAGVWIESEQLTLGWCQGNSTPDELDKEAKVTAFVPFAQIRYIFFLDYRAGDGSSIRKHQLLHFSPKEK